MNKFWNHWNISHEIPTNDEGRMVFMFVISYKKMKKVIDLENPFELKIIIVNFILINTNISTLCLSKNISST